MASTVFHVNRFLRKSVRVCHQKRKRYSYGLQRKVERKKNRSQFNSGRTCREGRCNRPHNYELGSRKPSNMVTMQKIADALNTTTEYLLGSSGTYVVEAHEKGGAKAAKDIEELVSEVTGMFAGGELSEDAIEGAYKALTDAYWIAKENNKKYAPKTRRKKSDQ
jgi:hypothetical protein